MDAAQPQAAGTRRTVLRLDALESSARATLQAVAKNEGALDGMAQHIRGFSQATEQSLASVRQTVDDKLAQTVTESRHGRTELLAAFQGFEGKLEQRLGGFENLLTQRLEALQLAVSTGLDDTSKTLLAHLGQAQTEAATGRKELTDARVPRRVGRGPGQPGGRECQVAPGHG